MPHSGVAVRPEAKERPEHLPWNFSVIVLDVSFYLFAIAFADGNTVLPAFLTRLTESPLLIGLIGTIRTAGWFLPQLLVASRLAHRPRKKPFLIVVCLLGRVPILSVVAVLMLAPDQPVLIMAVFFFAFTAFCFSEGAGGVPWTDIIGKAIPHWLRGRFFASTELVGGILAAAAGVGVKRILESPRIGYPGDYALLFFLSFSFLMVSLSFVAAIREPIRPVMNQEIRLGALVRNSKDMLRRRPALVPLLAAQLTLGASGMVAPFYVAHGRLNLGITEGMVGVFVSAQILGGMAASLLAGYLSDRKGSTWAIRGTTLCAIATPLAALVIPAAAGGTLSGAWPWAYAAVFAFLGATWHTLWIGFTNFLLESVSDEERASYVGLMNTLNAPQALFPLIASGIVAVASYQAAFAASLICALAASAIALTLQDPRAAR